MKSLHETPAPETRLATIDEDIYRGIDKNVKEIYGKNFAEIADIDPSFAFEAFATGFTAYTTGNFQTLVNKKEAHETGTTISAEDDGKPAFDGAMENGVRGMVGSMAERYKEDKNRRVIAVTKKLSLLDKVMKRPPSIETVAVLTESKPINEDA